MANPGHETVKVGVVTFLVAFPLLFAISLPTGLVNAHSGGGLFFVFVASAILAVIAGVLCARHPRLIKGFSIGLAIAMALVVIQTIIVLVVER